MTAYGRTEDSNNEISISCTIKSVNHRYSDISIHLPEELRPLEQKIREHISDKIQRGKVDCNIHIDKHHIHNEKLSINQDLLKKIVEASEKINSNLSDSAPLNSLDLLRWPGVLEKNIVSGDIKKFHYTAKSYNYDSQAYIYQMLFNKPLVFYVIDKNTEQLGVFSTTDAFLDKGREKVEKAVEVYNKFFGKEATEDINQYFLNIYIYRFKVK